MSDDMAVDLYLNVAFARSSIFLSFLFVAGKGHEGDGRPAESQGIQQVGSGPQRGRAHQSSFDCPLSYYLFKRYSRSGF